MLALFPLHFFFQFLYYTDVGSLVAVIATHLVGACRSEVACSGKSPSTLPNDTWVKKPCPI